MVCSSCFLRAIALLVLMASNPSTVTQRRSSGKQEGAADNKDCGGGDFVHAIDGRNLIPDPLPGATTTHEHSQRGSNGKQEGAAGRKQGGGGGGFIHDGCNLVPNLLPGARAIHEQRQHRPSNKEDAACKKQGGGGGGFVHAIDGRTADSFCSGADAATVVSRGVRHLRGGVHWRDVCILHLLLQWVATQHSLSGRRVHEAHPSATVSCLSSAAWGTCASHAALNCSVVQAQQPLVLVSSSRLLLLRCKSDDPASIRVFGTSFEYIRPWHLLYPLIVGILFIRCQPSFSLRLARAVHPGARVFDAPAFTPHRQACPTLCLSRRCSLLSRSQDLVVPGSFLQDLYVFWLL